MAKALTVQDFFKRFPDDDSCLEHLLKVRHGDSGDCPKCGKHTKWHRIRKQLAYECQWCGHHIHPMVGTPFERSHTALQKWFYAIYLFTTTRHGVSAKELQRQLGVTYKTAWRMGHEIRKYMAEVDGDRPLDGHVEIDEMYVGGKISRKDGKALSNKTIVLGMVERGGDVVAGVVSDTRAETMEPIIRHFVEPWSTITTDEHRSYQDLKRGYLHGVVEHSANEYVRGEHHTNTIEGYWALIKRSIRGTHVHVSSKYLDNYLGEFEYRFNLRKTPSVMFDRLIASF